jgi:hypothetical protein
MRLPDAPLSHADEKEHRRLLALRVNQSVAVSAFESGVWTPTFTFATPGDLSVTYTIQDGRYSRIGNLVNFSARVDCTPTFSTASGELRISLPFARMNAGQADVFPVRLSGPDVTWPTGLTSIVAFARANQAFLSLAFQGSSEAGANVAASNVTSAAALAILATGAYQADFAHP